VKLGNTANRRKAIVITGFCFCALLFGVSIPAQGQQTTDNVSRIGFLQRRVAPTPTNPDPLANAFLQGLRDLGYIDGKNIVVEHRYGGGKSESLSRIIAEFLQSKVDVIVVPGSPAIRAARQATKTVPIVIVTQSDPVADGLVDSLAHPGGNITGLTRLTSELSGKRLQLFKEAIPTIARVATLIGGAELIENVGDYEATARTLNLTLLPIRLAGAKLDIEAAFQNMAKSGVNALIVNRDALTASYMSGIAELAVRHRLPSMNEDRPYVEVGGLMSYGANDADQFKRAAYYVDRILRGTKPADLPVEQPTKFELVINLKTAKQIGLMIPPNVLARADRVIR
jgi:putative ABC transport system substrate-binding protein